MIGREQYESDEDRSNERKIISAFMDALNPDKGLYDVYKLSKESRVDYVIVKMGENSKGVELAFCEVKTRNNPIEQYETYFISESKFKTGIHLYNFGFKFFLIIRFTDGIYWYAYKPNHVIIYKDNDGRTKQTRDPWDIETMAHIPIVYFRRVTPT